MNIISTKNNTKKTKDKQTNMSFDKVYRKNLHDNLIDKTGEETLCKIFDDYVAEKKTEPSL